MNDYVAEPLPVGAEISSGRNANARVYQITKFLGRGGFGITYLAESTYYDNNIPQTGTYTIKEFCLSDVCRRNADGSFSLPDSAREEFDSAMKDFEHEAERLQGMSHPGIVPVNEVFHANGTVYYVMQFLGDMNLSKYLEQRGGRLSEDEACRIIERIGQALDYLHRERVTHLDVKPDNVMMVKSRKNGLQPVLIDFGLACHYKQNGNSTSRHSATGISEGYSPLEQYAGIEKFSPEADVYAMTATFFYMLTGKTPVKVANMKRSVLEDSISGLNLSNATTKALIGGLQKVAEDRIQSVQEFMETLRNNDWDIHDESRDGEDELRGKKTKRITQKQKDIDKKPIIYGVAGVAALAILAILFMTLGGKSSSSNDEEEGKVEIPVEVNNDTITGTVAGETTGTTTVVEEHTNNQTSPEPQQQTKPEQQQLKPSSGTLELGYATYSGKLKNGVPEGQGTMTFHQAKRYGNYRIQPGDRIEGEFTDGQPEYGTWYKSDGTSEMITIGGI